MFGREVNSPVFSVRHRQTLAASRQKGNASIIPLSAENDNEARCGILNGGPPQILSAKGVQ